MKPTRDSWRISVSTLCVGATLLVMAPRATAQGPRHGRAIVLDHQASAGRTVMEPCEGPAPVCALFLRFLTSFNARDFDGFRQTFAPDISFFVDRPYPPRRLDGRAAAEEVFARGFAPYGPSASDPMPPLPPPLVPSHLRVQAFGDVAIITFEVVRPTEIARRTLVAHGMNGEWRIVHMHASSADTPP